MTNVAASFIPTGTTGVTAKNTLKNQAADKASFDDLMAQAELKADALGFADQFLEALTRSVKGKSSAQSSGNIFPFSSTFESVFGSSGPLIDFINLTTARLNLSAGQNQALQNIAINNKDITNTPANVQKIAAELKAAGIG